jgi:membrane protein YqaA with SNARE-associated domain
MEETLIRFGIPALFLVAFLAATVVPLGSEWLLAALLLQGADPVAAVAAATAGNFLGACTTWALGTWGSPWLLDRVLRIDGSAQERAKGLFARYGAWALLMSWVPVIGDPLCLIAGLLKMPILRFAPPTFTGKLGRYVALALTVGGFT